MQFGNQKGAMIDLKLICCLGLLFCVANAYKPKIWEQRIGIPPADPPNARARAPTWGHITQKLDHYSSTDQRVWSMRYLKNDQFYQPGGPFFIFIGGEWEIDSGWLMSGQMFDMAKQHRGYMFYTEHRFYGHSYPLGDFSTSSLKYIRSQQALADLANFIVQMKNEIPGAGYSKVVVVGASYSASLATWSRLLYPGLIDAAYASSAPLIAIEDFYQYEEVVGTNIRLVSQQCYNVLNEGIAEIDKYFATTQGMQLLGQILSTCRPVRNDEPYKAYLFNTISVMWSGLVQYAQPGQIANECYQLTSKQGTSFQKLVAYLKQKQGNYCMGDYDDFVNAFIGTAINSGSSRQWIFQTCEEFGFFQTTSSRNQPFGNHIFVNYFHHMCKDIYGQQYTPNQIKANIKYSNQVYGGINRNMTYVVSVHGSVDPWHAIGLTSDLHQLAPAFLVQGTAHCDDLRSISQADLPQMRQVKQRVKDIIAQWIN